MLSGRDLTPGAVLVKLMALLGDPELNREEVCRLAVQDIAGESS